jgi:hypothetical protein
MSEFVRNPNFPSSNTRVTGSNKLWKLEVREWAFASVDAIDVPEGLQPESNNPNVSPGCRDPSDSKIQGTRGSDRTKITVRFYAKAEGFTIIHLFKDDPFKAEFDGLQVQVMKRQASAPDHISLAKLEGTTFVVNAPDARAYSGTQTSTFEVTGKSISNIFDDVPTGADHVVISSHGGFVGSTAQPDTELCMFAAGTRNLGERLGVHNVTDIFSKLRGRVANTCVLWLGGCNIGDNNEFCQKAANASGCQVVAAHNALQNSRFPSGHIDLIDRYAGPKLFVPNKGSPVFVGELCAKQALHKFSVPI